MAEWCILLEDRHHLGQNLVHNYIRQSLHQPAIPGVDVQDAGLIAPDASCRLRPASGQWHSEPQTPREAPAIRMGMLSFW